MAKKKRDIPRSQSQTRLLRVLNIPFDSALDYYAIGDLLQSNGFPKNGIPFDVNPSTAKGWSDETLILEAIRQKHMKEEHNLIWCVVCKTFHEMNNTHNRMED
ncbi:hypothetical protein E8L90_17945 [Brevibacillus antibioticus]|uniref:Uncharacterized protein n=1 Tax=Brevibacillus antibioticus TaxID=2570228 RepID=A0A4U2Y942_9BACL|nr:hypothetical protein [Brevibacillus antibioticus]TKI57187.1 hypothetical protein E8L90_17945 [Brevibacillus antibioticus]